MLNSVRTRLTLWYVLIFGALLLAFCLCLYGLIARSLRTELDLSLTKLAQTAAKLYQGELAENGSNAAVATEHFFNEFRPPHLYVALLQADAGQAPKLLATNFAQGQPPAVPSTAKPELPTVATLNEAERQKQPLPIEARWFGPESGRLVIYAFTAEGQNFFVLVGASRAESRAQLAALRRIFYFSLPLLLLVAGVAGFWFAHQALAPVAAMTAQAERISAQNLHERLCTGKTNDELSQLAQVFNQLLERLERSFDSMRAFTADASHELRTPLAIIRGEADVALAQDRPAAEYRETLAIVQDEARRLSTLVDEMLALARADAGQRPLQLTELYLNDLVEECCRAAKVLAIGKQLSLSLEPAEDIQLRGDEDLLRRLILNLLDNAIKYTPSGGKIVLKLARQTDCAELRVIDTGVGIPAEATTRVFERFYRVDKARSRAAGGSGLGLPIAKWVVEAHHGTITLASKPGQGSTFTVRLPLK
jgi:heavy metal sensor kinase